MSDFPRQLSANGEHGFPVHPCCGRVRVFVNGDMLRNVIAFDADAGWVEVIAHDEQGCLMRKDGHWQVTRYLGDIRAELS